MLSNLFDDECPKGESVKIYSKNSKNMSKPDAPRKKNNFCGIINQGATCYLNTLLQTLFLTPEFRESLFSLPPEELGLIPLTGNTKIRVIPIELQRLFTELLLIDQDSCGTKKLTDSFGWSNQEGTEQHDVQELNRILFSAIENSLVNTSQSGLIQKLYKGTIINKIHCLNCSKTNSREEEFLDIQITVQGSNSLTNSLMNSYMFREKLNGNNQYKCENCCKYTDAEKYSQLKSLPPILTLSLLRFTYDMQTYQRIKVSDRFEFPLELDLKEYLEDDYKLKVSDEYSKYELFSVIIHSGSAYGGHYHTYIKDVENLGNWIVDEEEKKTMKIKQDLISNSSNKEINLIRENQGDADIDYLKYENPVELIKAFIFNNHAYKQVKVDSISSDLTKHGMSWNKTYKSKYGTMAKFLKKNDDVFELTEDEKLVNLKANFKINEILSADYENFKNEKVKKQKELEDLEIELNNEEQELEKNLENLHLNSWFDFNDEKVQSIKPSVIEKQFAGKESAYMLFYRRKSQELKKRIIDEESKQVPSWLIEEIRQKNEALRAQRQIYDKNIYELNVKFYLDINFVVSEPNKILKIQNDASFCCFKIDKRDKVCDLKEKLVSYCTSIENNELNETILNYILTSDNLKYLLCKQNPLECHYISKILDNNETLSNFQQNYSIILSNNNDSAFCIGDQYEPIKLIIKYYYDDEAINYKKFNEFSEIFTKQTTIKEIKDQLADVSLNNKKEIKLVSIEKNKKIILNRQFGIDTKHLSEYEIKNNDYLIVDNGEGEEDDELRKTTTKSVKKQSNDNKEQITIEIVNFIENPASHDHLDDSLKYTQIEFSVNKSDQVNNVKILAISAFSLDSVNYDECHLRYINSGSVTHADLINEFKSSKNRERNIFSGLRLYENEVIENFIELDTSSLFVLCNRRAPLENEINLKCCCILDNNDKSIGGQNLTDEVKCEILASKALTVDELVKIIIEELNLSLTEVDVLNNQVYYLKKVNWMGDPDAILNSLTKTLNDVNLSNNSYVCVTKGFLVPQNHVKINIWLHALNSVNEDEMIDKKLLNTCDMSSINDEFKYVNCLICKYDLKLEELKVKIGECLSKNLSIELDLNEDLIRIRLMKKIVIKNSSNKKIFVEKYQLKKALFDWHKTLKQINLSNEVDLCVELTETGGLNQGIVLLGCMRLDLKTNKYSNYKEISWNINNGANLSSIKQTIVKEYNLEANDVFSISIAKRLVEKYDWILIKDTATANTDDSVNVSKKGRKPKTSIQQQQLAKSNLKSAPYYLDDGDLIGFVMLKDEETLKIATMQTISNKEFMTKNDLDYKTNQIDLNKLKKTNKAGGKDLLDVVGSRGTRRNRRAEVGIVIKTEDFN